MPISKALAAIIYFAVAVLVAWVLHTRSGSEQHKKPFVRFWVLATALLTVLGFEKVTNLELVIAGTMRCISQMQGWYAYREPYQVLLTLLIVLGTGFLVRASALHFWRELHSSALAGVGVVLIISYQLTRVVSFHGVDALISMKIAGLSLNSMVELAGILCIAGNAIWLVLASPKLR